MKPRRPAAPPPVPVPAQKYNGRLKARAERTKKVRPRIDLTDDAALRQSQLGQILDECRMVFAIGPPEVHKVRPPPLAPQQCMKPRARCPPPAAHEAPRPAAPCMMPPRVNGAPPPAPAQELKQPLSYAKERTDKHSLHEQAVANGYRGGKMAKVKDEKTAVGGEVSSALARCAAPRKAAEAAAKEEYGLQQKEARKGRQADRRRRQQGQHGVKPEKNDCQW